jgi:hypothetical protein
MAILKIKQKVRQQADDLLKNYDIKYNPDGETFSIYAKGDASGTKGRSENLAPADKTFPGLRRRLVTKRFEAGAEQARLEALKKVNDEKIKKLEIIQGEIDKNPGDEDPPIIKKNNGLTDKDPPITKNNGLTDEDPPIIKKDNESIDGDPPIKSDPIKVTKSEDIAYAGEKSPDVILGDNVYENKSNYMSPLRGIASMFFDEVYEPGLGEFLKAKRANKKFLVVYNDVYDVDDNIVSYNRDGDLWSPKVSQEYYRKYKYSPEILAKPIIEEGIKPKSWVDHINPWYSSEATSGGRPASLLDFLVPFGKPSISPLLRKANQVKKEMEESSRLKTDRKLIPKQ